MAADGARSPLAASCGIRWQRDDYQQLAVIANVATQLPHQGRAFERFTRHGRWRCCQCPATVCRWWCHPAAAEATVKQWDDATFLHELQRAFGWRLGRFTHAGQREIYPLALQTAERQVTHRLALVGNGADAAPDRWPGFNLGLRDVMSLAETRRRRIVTSRIPAATRCCTILLRAASRIARRPLASPTVWCGCSPTVMPRWWQDEILGWWQWTTCHGCETHLPCARSAGLSVKHELRGSNANI